MRKRSARSIIGSLISSIPWRFGYGRLRLWNRPGTTRTRATCVVLVVDLLRLGSPLDEAFKLTNFARTLHHDKVRPVDADEGIDDFPNIRCAKSSINALSSLVPTPWRFAMQLQIDLKQGLRKFAPSEWHRSRSKLLSFFASHSPRPPLPLFRPPAEPINNERRKNSTFTPLPLSSLEISLRLEVFFFS